VGALLGTPVGQSYSTNREAIPELRSVLAKDGVHLEIRGKRNLSVAIITAIENLRSGKNQCMDAHEVGAGTGTGTRIGSEAGIRNFRLAREGEGVFLEGLYLTGR
jgi:hypothetical protein